MPYCRRVISPISEYRFKMCIRCRARARLKARERRPGSDIARTSIPDLYDDPTLLGQYLQNMQRKGKKRKRKDSGERPEVNVRVCDISVVILMSTSHLIVVLDRAHASTPFNMREESVQ